MEKKNIYNDNFKWRRKGKPNAGMTLIFPGVSHAYLVGTVNPAGW